MGENGAGKSTLMSILYGMQRPDEGEILLGGRRVVYRSALDAIAEGMGMVHQAFKLFDRLTVWENVVYGREPQRFGLIDRAAPQSTASPRWPRATSSPSTRAPSSARSRSASASGSRS